MKKPDAKQIQQLLKSEQFDAEWYLRSYPDVAALGMDPAEHYLTYGYVMKRATSAKGAHTPVPIAARAAAQLPTPDMSKRARILVNANEVAKSGDHPRAIALAEAHLPADLAYTANVLRANAAIAQGDEQAWQTHLNNYLSHFDVAPIRLEGTGTVFDRLACDPLPKVTSGPLISVIMPAWNAEKMVRKAALSILNQTWRNLELLIVDDCSTDETWAVLQQIAASDSRVKIMRNKVNVGPYVSKNVALIQAKGEWITGHDADDWAHPLRLAGQFSFCSENQLTASMSGMLRVASSGQFVRLNPIHGFVYDGACRSGFISLMIRTQYFRDILGGWDAVRTSGDSELLRRIEAIEKKSVRQLQSVTMFCLDNPDGLTNHPTLGHNENQPVSPLRLQYKEAFTTWHAGITKFNARMDARSPRRLFEAPAAICANETDVKSVFNAHITAGQYPKPDIEADVVLLTNTCFIGGNAFSTIDELSFFRDLKVSVALVHCPSDSDQMMGRQIAERYHPYLRHWHNGSDVKSIRCRVLICRHPTTITSQIFRSMVKRISADHVFFVKNNSSLRPDGSSVYQIADMIKAGTMLRAKNITFCPISPVMREELETYRRESDSDFQLSDMDWTPTFDLALYMQSPKLRMSLPFRIGRHGRDGAEKWFEEAQVLRSIYPDDPDFIVSILGGAKQAENLMNTLPSNWVVHKFGSVEPDQYLSELDAFVYFPNSSLVEAFGRTIVEAMLACVPVILPRRFEATFGDLPLYCEPLEVADLVRKLAQDDVARIAYLTEVQQIAVKRYASQVIARRLAHVDLPGLAIAAVATGLSLSAKSLHYRNKVMR